ncbi:MAG: ABC transporter substrate-binding protein [Candidatus Cloacimonetes bacterium]|nr:ABC transporter substrate-binding protein [Candidatus Cloacimonadota bacterium]
MKKRIPIIVILCMIILCSQVLQAQSNDAISLMVQWFPQAQFAGYIVAHEKGFYNQADIDAIILFSDGTDSPLQEVLDERIEFCTGWLSQAIMLRSENEPILNICQMLQKSSLMLIAKKESGIETAQDFEGKVVSNWGGDFSIQPIAFFQKQNIEPTVIPQSFRIDGFLVGAIDITSAMYYNEYHKIMQAGIDEDELVTFFFTDYDLNFPEDGIYCREEIYHSNPDLCKRFVDASLKGWAYAFEHKEESLDLVMKYCREYHMQTNRSHQRWMLNAIETAMTYQVGDDLVNWGVLKKDDYYTVAEELLHQGLITTIPSYTEFYKDVAHER